MSRISFFQENPPSQEFNRARSAVNRLTPGIAAIGLAAGLILTGCQVAEKSNSEPVVTTVNPNYNRLHSHVLVRRVKTPTEGFLDFAAYSKNVMLADPQWHAVHPTSKISLAAVSFGGKLQEVKPLLDFTPLTDAEKNQPLAWGPVLEHLLKWNFDKASKLANDYSTITGEKWGDTSDVSQPFQEFSAVYIHSKGSIKEVWVEVEFKPWLNSFMDGILDQDRDGYPEAVGRLDPHLFTSEMAEEIAGDYASKILTEPQVIDWARNLASRWYPSYNTDLLELKPGMPWPYEESTEAAKKEMTGLWINNPLFILKGHPFDDTLFNVFEVDGMGGAKTPAQKKQEGTPVARGLDKGLTDRLTTITSALDGEVKAYGNGKWPEWIKRLAPFQQEVQRFAGTEPKEILGIMAPDKVLVFRRELDYLVAPDIDASTSTQHPLQAIAGFKDYLAQQGIDFLFIPIPTKLDLYPETVAPGADSLPGHIAQPNVRKLMRDLADARVETLDLLTPFLKIKASSEDGKRVLYQKQDTHWTTVGLECAAQVVADRIKLYSWFDAAFKDKRDYHVHDSVFESLGDIQARLTDAKKAQVAPEHVLGHQVLDNAGQFYEDTDSSSVLILGDSYTGVFQSVGCRHAGVTAHIARNLGAPVDLIMGWGGGPEAPSKLKKRGGDYLKNKRLVVWMMSARDIFVYPGDWTVK